MKENNTKIDGYIRIKGSESNSYDINDIDYNKIKNSLTGITNFINKMMQTIKPLIDTMANYVQSYTPYFKGLAEAIEKAKQDPDSIINWYEYCEKLSEYFWTIPYGMKSSDLKNIIENVRSDIEFDKYMKTYFSKKLVGNLIKEIDENLPQKHKRLFNQIQKAYNEKSYALVNTGIMSIIDGLCTYYLLDKGRPSRVNMFKPIINNLKLEHELVFILIMLNNNINLLYEKIEFNEKIKINTSKKVRRNPNQHGQLYTNRKMDCIMLLNTLYYLTTIQNKLRKYKSSIYKKDGKTEFYIPTINERIEIKEKIKKN